MGITTAGSDIVTQSNSGTTVPAASFVRARGDGFIVMENNGDNLLLSNAGTIDTVDGQIHLRSDDMFLDLGGTGTITAGGANNVYLGVFNTATDEIRLVMDGTANDADDDLELEEDELESVTISHENYALVIGLTTTASDADDGDITTSDISSVVFAGTNAITLDDPRAVLLLTRGLQDSAPNTRLAAVDGLVGREAAWFDWLTI